MALSRIVIRGDGVTTLLPLEFALGEISASHVTLRVDNEVDGSGNPLYRSFVVLPNGLVQVSGTPAVNGGIYQFDRTVPKDELVVDWSDGDAITGDNLDTTQKHALMMAHEALDGRISPTQDIDFKGQYTVAGLREAAKAGDAVVYEQYELLLDMLQAIPEEMIDLVDGGIYFPAIPGIGPSLDGGIY